MLVESPSHEVVRGRDRVFRRALVGADLLAGLLVVGLADRLFGVFGPGEAAFALLPLIVVINTSCGLYRRDELLLRKSTLDEAPAVFHAATLTTVVAFLLESVLLRTPMSAHLMAVTWIGLTVLEIACRVAARAIARAATAPERCLLVGDAAIADRVRAKLLASPNVKATFVGWIPLDARPGTTTAPVLGTPDELDRVVAEHDVHRVIVAGDAAAHQSVLDVIQRAKAMGMRVSVLPRMFEVVGSSAAFDYLDGLTMLGVRRFGLSPASRRVKRAFDVVGSAFCLVLLAPLMIAIALLVRLTSPGPALFRQTRVGRDGRTFEMLKYRSMHDGADARKAELLGRNEADGLFKIADDPRITRARALAAKDVARRAPAAGQRPARPDEPRRPAPAGGGGRPARRGLVPPASAPDARHHRRMAGVRRRPHPAARDGHHRLSVRLELVAVGGHQDPAAHDSVRGGPARPVTRAGRR